MVKNFLVVLAISLVSLSTNALDCYDNYGNAVDWFTLIKLPEVTGAPPIPGKSYMFFDSSHTNPQVNDRALNLTSPITYTLNQFNKDKSINVLFWNDEVPPSQPNYNFYTAHSKGIMAYTEAEAIFIVHSIPKFAYYQSNGEILLDILHPEMMYGQNMMCIKLNREDLFSIAGLLSIAHPQVYYHNINIENANITLMIKNETNLSIDRGFHKFNANGMPFTYFAKNAGSKTDFWEDLVAKEYGADMIVQSWGRPYMPNFCLNSNTYSVQNTKKLQVQSYWWTSYYDHSKWGLGKFQKIVCYADINRMWSQRERGGGGLCVLNDNIWSMHKKIVTEVMPCN